MYYGSDVRGQPDLIEGDTALKTFSAGYYQANGIAVSKSDVTSRQMSVRPRTPFSVSSKTWSKEDFIWFNPFAAKYINVYVIPSAEYLNK